MTIDEAISHAMEVAERNECKMTSDDGYTDVSMKRCAAEHRQLAEWLRELKEAKRLLKQVCCDFSDDKAVRLDHLNEALQFLKLIGDERNEP